MVELSQILIVFFSETEATIGVLISCKSQETQSYIKVLHIIYYYRGKILLRPLELLAPPASSMGPRSASTAG